MEVLTHKQVLDTCINYLKSGRLKEPLQIMSVYLDYGDSDYYNIHMLLTRYNQTLTLQKSEGFSEDVSVEFNRVANSLGRIIHGRQATTRAEGYLALVKKHKVSNLIAEFDSPDFYNSFNFTISHRRPRPFSMYYVMEGDSVREFYPARSFEFLLNFTNNTNAEVRIKSIAIRTNSFIIADDVSRILEVSTFLGLRKIPKFYVQLTTEIGGSVELLEKNEIFEVGPNKSEPISIEIPESFDKYGFYDVNIVVTYDSVNNDEVIESHSIYIGNVKSNSENYIRLHSIKEVSFRPIKVLLRCNNNDWNILKNRADSNVPVFIGNTPIENHFNLTDDDWKVRVPINIPGVVSIGEEDGLIGLHNLNLSPIDLGVMQLSEVLFSLNLPVYVSEVPNDLNPNIYLLNEAHRVINDVVAGNDDLENEETQTDDSNEVDSVSQEGLYDFMLNLIREPKSTVKEEE